jgi:EmrB/QacA subfamily drug resistance transporter
MQTAAQSSRSWKVLAVTSLATFAAALDTSIMFMAFPDIGRTFSDVSRADLSWVINAYIIVFAALLVPAGRLADRLGRKRVFLTGVVVFTTASALCGAAPEPELLIAARTLQAVGGAALFPSALALVLTEFPLHRRASAVAIWSGVGALAAALGPSVGGVIIDTAGWRWAFYMNLPVGLIALTLGLRLLRESRAEDAQTSTDFIGAGLLIAGVGALALGIVQTDEWGWGDTRTLLAFAAAAAILPLFLLRSATHHSPALDLSLFNSHNFRMANLATLIFGLAFSAMFLGVVLFLTLVWQYSILKAGLTIWPGPLTAALVAGPAGRMADRIGHRRLLVSGALFFAAGSAWLLLRAELEPDVWGVWIPSAIMTGIGVGLAMPSLASAAVQSLEQNRFAVGSAVNQTVRQIASVLGVALVIALLGSPEPAKLLDAFDRVYLLMVIASLVTGVICLTIDTAPRPAPELVLVPSEQEAATEGVP